MDADVDSRTEALEQIAVLARRHSLSLDDIGDVIGQTARGPGDYRRTVLVRVLGYLGGTFVFAGIGVFIALQWEWMNAAARIIVTLGSGISALTLALLAVRDVRFEKAATPLFLTAAVTEPTGMLVAFNELGRGNDWRWAGVITAGTMALQFMAVFRPVNRATPLFFSILFTVLFWWTALDLLGARGHVAALVLGTSLLAASIGIDRTVHRVITPVWYLLGSALFLYGLFDIVEGTPAEIVFVAAAAGLVYLSVVVHSRTVLFVATAGLLAYTAWFTGEHFADSLGWPLALVMLGLLMMAMSALAFRIDRDYVQRSRT